MKKLLVTTLCALMLFSSAAYADEPTPALENTPVPTVSPNPTFTPSAGDGAPFSGLISLNALQNATNEDVVRVQIRLRDLCYFPFKPTGVFQSMTANAAKAFQLKHTTDDGAPMIADGTIGTQSMNVLFRHSVARADITAGIPIGSGQTVEAPAIGEAAPWSEVKGLLIEGTTYLITDFNTGVTFYMAFTGGENHAEMECKDSFNSSILRDVFGGEYNFSKRPVTVSVSGRQIAASLQGYPHGEDNYGANEMTGHTCLFFDGSLSHVGMLPDAEHQEMIYKASGRN